VPGAASFTEFVKGALFFKFAHIPSAVKKSEIGKEGKPSTGKKKKRRGIRL
jgi:hypothetical protein